MAAREPVARERGVVEDLSLWLRGGSDAWRDTRATSILSDGKMVYVAGRGDRVGFGGEALMWVRPAPGPGAGVALVGIGVVMMGRRKRRVSAGVRVC